jgi:hypothetical protein
MQVSGSSTQGYWTAMLGAVAALWLALAGSRPALAGEFELGEVRGSIDTTISVRAAMRVEDRDCDLVFSGNGGCNDNPAWTNADDGNLNYDKCWRNYGAFMRGNLFYDIVTMDTNTSRTDLDQDARYRSSLINSGVVGTGAQVLDAYVWGNYEIAGRPVELRFCNQVINWGESLFFPGGAASTNTIDVAKIRTPGSEVREALVPAPMIRVSAELYENLGLEMYYQGYWSPTQVDPVGSYFSTNDLVGRAAEGFFLDADPGSRGMDADEVFEQGFPVDPVITQVFPPTGDPLQDRLLPFMRAQGSDPSTITHVPAFFPVGVPRLNDEKPSTQGQWGATLRYYLESIQTEFGVHYLRIHDKNPSVGFEAEPFSFNAETFLLRKSWPVTVMLPCGGAAPPGCVINIPIRSELPRGSVASTPQTVGIPTGYFREYPEDIDIFAGSFATELFGVAVQGEVSYRTGQPVAVVTSFFEALAQAEAQGRRVRVSGYERENMLQTQLSGIAAFGPGHPLFGPIVELLHVDTLNVAGEIAMVRFPGLEDENVYAGPGFTGQLPAEARPVFFRTGAGGCGGDQQEEDRERQFPHGWGFLRGRHPKPILGSRLRWRELDLLFLTHDLSDP